MTTPDDLYEGLIRSPDDWHLRSVLADWYEDAGQQDVADCLRWMAQHRKRPFPSTEGSYHWFDAARDRTVMDPESTIPEPLYRRLRGKERDNKGFRDYGDLRSADEDFYRAWREARRRGWDGQP